MMPDKIPMTMATFHDANENYIGYCANCGAEKEACEPDARNYKCDDCGLLEVYGTQELLMMDKIELIDGDDDDD